MFWKKWPTNTKGQVNNIGTYLPIYDLMGSISVCRKWKTGDMQTEKFKLYKDMYENQRGLGWESFQRYTTNPTNYITHIMRKVSISNVDNLYGTGIKWGSISMSCGKASLFRLFTENNTIQNVEILSKPNFGSAHISWNKSHIMTGLSCTFFHCIFVSHIKFGHHNEVFNIYHILFITSILHRNWMQYGGSSISFSYRILQQTFQDLVWPLVNAPWTNVTLLFCFLSFNQVNIGSENELTAVFHFLSFTYNW